jgi:hypothetical protein
MFYNLKLQYRQISLRCFIIQNYSTGRYSLDVLLFNYSTGRFLLDVLLFKTTVQADIS